jgi:hypothetical protein
MVSHTMLGVTLNLLGGISTSVGWCLQKFSHNRSHKSRQPYYKDLLWWVGLIFILISQPLYIVSNSMANQSTLGVVGPFSIIINIIFARIFLNEQATWWEYLGIMLFIPGSIFTILSASRTNHLLNREKFNELFYSTQSVLYLSGNALACILLYFLTKQMTKPLIPDILEKTEKEPLLPDTTDILEPIGMIRII